MELFLIEKSLSKVKEKKLMQNNYKKTSFDYLKPFMQILNTIVASETFQKSNTKKIENAKTFDEKKSFRQVFFFLNF